MAQGYKWKPIEDLPDDWQKLASSELAGLFAVWKDHVVTLKDSPAYLEFQARLRREWAIETGIIEGLYDIDRGVTRTLIERGLHASLIAHGDANKPAEEIIPMLKDHEMVVEGLFDFVGQKRELSTSYIKQIHQALTTHQETATGIDSFGRRTQIPLLQGDWKKWPNNPTRPDGSIHEYCPPEQVASEMDRLIEMHQRHLQQGIPPEVEAAWLHHRFTQIHPFQDGNGRVARALASLIFLRAEWFPLVINRNDRTEYISALEAADQRNLSDLVALFVRKQKQAFNQGIGISENVLLENEPLQEMIAAATGRIRERKRKKLEDTVLAHRLIEVTQEKLNSIAVDLNSQLATVDENYRAFTERDNGNNALAFNSEVATVAQQLGYFANTRIYCSWVYLGIREERLALIVLSAHGVGTNFPGLMAISAFIEYQSWKNPAGRSTETPYPLTREPFQFSTRDAEPDVVKRFLSWLDEAILTGLDMWRKQL